MASGRSAAHEIVPERYGTTPLYAQLRLVERFGSGIVPMLGEMDERGVRQLVEFDGLRQVEDVRQLALMMGHVRQS